MHLRPPRRHSHSLMGRRFGKDFEASTSSNGAVSHQDAALSTSPSSTVFDDLKAYFSPPSRSSSAVRDRHHQKPQRRNASVSVTRHPSSTSSTSSSSSPSLSSPIASSSGLTSSDCTGTGNSVESVERRGRSAKRNGPSATPLKEDPAEAVYPWFLMGGGNFNPLRFPATCADAGKRPDWRTMADCAHVAGLPQSEEACGISQVGAILVVITFPLYSNCMIKYCVSNWWPLKNTKDGGRVEGSAERDSQSQQRYQSTEKNPYFQPEHTFSTNSIATESFGSTRSNPTRILNRLLRLEKASEQAAADVEEIAGTITSAEESVKASLSSARAKLQALGGTTGVLL
ncbi:hypothetical protein DFJ73DRAFT_758689 [Zopfochytrium polystomum]|nr:hypothetical protein DFJ73DRAFT_758689 [Zopfochytrium polystomum]